MGDYADAITHSDERRYDFDSLDPELPTPDEQYAWVRAEFAKIKTNCLGLHIGNHDFELQRRHEHRYVKMDLCDSLELPFLGYNAMTRLKFILKKRNGERMHRNGGTITIASTHGSTNARTAGGKINPMLLWASGLSADIYLYAHTHDKYAHEERYYALSTNESLVERTRVYCLTGGFLEGYQQGTLSYVERKNLRPLKTGVVKIIVNPMTLRIRAQA